MTMQNPWTDFVHPDTLRPLRFTSENNAWMDGKESFPILNGIPFLLPDPAISLALWKNKVRNLIVYLNQEVTGLKSDPAVKTNKTWMDYCKARQQFMNSMAHLMQPLIQQDLGQQLNSNPLGQDMISSQNLLGYETNVFRDWGWPGDENDQFLRLLQRSWDSDKDINSDLLVLGAGTCRLVHDLCQKISLKKVLAVDINPYMLFAAQKIMLDSANQGLDLHEFSRHPKSSIERTKLWNLRRQGPMPGNVQLILADASCPPFADGSFDRVLTPWLIDVLPQSPTKFFRTLNAILKPDGVWINFGPLLFGGDDVREQYNLEQILQVARESGFEIESQEEESLPYLNSPLESGSRFETVYCFRAIKKKSLQRTPFSDAHPDWLQDTKVPIKPIEPFQAFAQTHQVYAQVASLVDGKATIESISKLFASQNKIPEQQAKDSILQFFSKIQST